MNSLREENHPNSKLGKEHRFHKSELYKKKKKNNPNTTQTHKKCLTSVTKKCK